MVYEYFNPKKAPIFFICTFAVEKGWNGPYTVAYLANGHKLFKSKTIKKWSEETNLLRTDQSHMVNPSFIKKLVILPNRTGEIHLRGSDRKIPVSRRYLSKVRKQIQNIPIIFPSPTQPFRKVQ
jgi:hypothetical protein